MRHISHIKHKFKEDNADNPFNPCKIKITNNDDPSTTLLTFLFYLFITG